MNYWHEWSSFAQKSVASRKDIFEYDWDFFSFLRHRNPRSSVTCFKKVRKDWSDSAAFVVCFAQFYYGTKSLRFSRENVRTHLNRFGAQAVFIWYTGPCSSQRSTCWDASFCVYRHFMLSALCDTCVWADEHMSECFDEKWLNASQNKSECAHARSRAFLCWLQLMSSEFVGALNANGILQICNICDRNGDDLRRNSSPYAFKKCKATARKREGGRQRTSRAEHRDKYRSIAQNNGLIHSRALPFFVRSTENGRVQCESKMFGNTQRRAFGWDSWESSENRKNVNIFAFIFDWP